MNYIKLNGSVENDIENVLYNKTGIEMFEEFLSEDVMSLIVSKHLKKNTNFIISSEDVTIVIEFLIFRGY